MSTMIYKNLTTVPARLTVPTCVGCGAMQRLGTCESSCDEQRLELVRAAAYDELLAVRQGARACTDAFRAVVEEFVRCQPAAARLEVAYRSMQDEARTVLRRFPDPPLLDQVLRGPTQPSTTSWCAECGGIDAPQQCLEFCIWREVGWVNYTSYQRERMRAVSEWLIESRLREMLRRIAWVTPLKGEWAWTWRALQAEARTTLEALNSPSSKALSGDAMERLENGGSRRAPVDPTGDGDTRAATLNVTADDGESDEYEYERGHEEGMTWAREFATIGVLCDLVEKPEIVGSEFKTPHWRGFVSGAEEVRQVIVPRTTATWRHSSGERFARSAC